MDVEGAKRRAGERAADAVPDGATVGLGSGSTAAHAVRALGRRVEDGLDIEGVATSYQSRAVAKSAGVPLVPPEDVTGIDVAIDGADQVAGDDLVKGGGGAHAREKLIDAAADEFHVVVDERKLAGRLDHDVPVEVLPAARSLVARDLRAMGGAPQLRSASAKSGPVVTDNGNLLLDCDFGTVDEPGKLARGLSDLPGTVEHGLFVGMADRVYVGTATDVERRDP